MIISLFMEEAPLCWARKDRCGEHACADTGGRGSGSQARDEREQQILDHKSSGRDVRKPVVAAGFSRPAGPRNADLPYQFVNRLILTFRIRPKPASVAIIDEPP
jgi:hypothetical protein